MDLNEFNAPLPKPWLNIQTNSILSQNSYSLNDISLGHVSSNIGTGTLDITPDNLVNGTIGCIAAGTLTIQLPTETEINDFLGPLPSSSFLSFKFNAYASGSTGPVSQINFLLGSGMSTFNGVSTFSVLTGTHKVLTFLKSGSNWVIYF
jgi:hypothetical protein